MYNTRRHCRREYHYYKPKHDKKHILITELLSYLRTVVNAKDLEALMYGLWANLWKECLAHTREQTTATMNKQY